MVHVAVAHQDGGHGRERAVGAAGVECEMELGKEDQSAVTGPRAADEV
jgi:hypothetical protein